MSNDELHDMVHAISVLHVIAINSRCWALINSDFDRRMSTCAACSAFCNEAPFCQTFLSEGILNDMQSNSVLHTAAWVEKLSLGNNLQQKATVASLWSAFI